MIVRLGTAAFCFACLLIPAAFAGQTSQPPTLDCALGFAGLRSQVFALPGIQQAQENGFDVVTLSEPDAWRVQIAFTQAGHPAHPATMIRTFRKQVTGVWTAESKGCGFGNPGQFAALMADMKSEDTRLTNASRAEVERQKQEQSPLAPMP
jgi:hypothetical protein